MLQFPKMYIIPVDSYRKMEQRKITAVQEWD